MFIEKSFNGAFKIHLHMRFSHQFHSQISYQVEKSLKLLIFKFNFKQIPKKLSSKHKELVFVDFVLFSELDIVNVRLWAENNIFWIILQKADNKLNSAGQ